MPVPNSRSLRATLTIIAFSRPALILGVMLCVISTSKAQSKKAPGPDVHRFQSPDHAVTLQYSYPMALCQKGDAPGCREDILNLCSADEDTVKGVACFAYAGKSYDRYNFRSAILSLGRLRNAKDEVACLDLPGTKQNREQINGISFASSQDSEGAMGTLVDHRYYRAFRGGQCYAADLSIATSNYGAMDPATVKEFKPSDFDKVYAELNRLLNTLRIAGSE
jgi:hypothetical protein